MESSELQVFLCEDCLFKPQQCAIPLLLMYTVRAGRTGEVSECSSAESWTIWELIVCLDYHFTLLTEQICSKHTLNLC